MLMEDILMLSLMTIPLAVVGGILYHLGGFGEPFNTKYRNLGVPVIMLVFMSCTTGFHWSLALCFIAMFGAQTTYFKKTEDSKWWNWALCGMAFGLCMAPWTVMTGGSGLGFFIRFVIVTVFTTIWSSLIEEVSIEEYGRGFVQIITLPFLLI